MTEAILYGMRSRDRARNHAYPVNAQRSWMPMRIGYAAPPYVGWGMIQSGDRVIHSRASDYSRTAPMMTPSMSSAALPWRALP